MESSSTGRSRSPEPTPSGERVRSLDLAHVVSISEASGMGLSALARRAEQGEPVLLLRNGKPVATVLPIQAYFDWTSPAPGEVQS